MRQRFIQSFSTSGTEQEALYANELGKPYVCFIEDGLYIDWNTLTPVIPYEEQPLTFEILSAGTIEWTASSSLTKTIQYSLNGGEWTSITSTTAGTPINVSEGDIVKFKGYNSTYANQSGWNCFVGSAYFNAYGNIMSLIDGDNFKELTAFTSANTYAFRNLFCITKGQVYGGANLIDASNLILPALTLSDYCYWGMFEDTLLEAAPVLPATTLASNCYRSIFCRTKLTTSPELPATTMVQGCYMYMFYQTTTLTTAPELPATNLADGCYSYMFDECTSLTAAPELPATNLAVGCYQQMFAGCTSLTKAPTELPATTLIPGSGMTTYGCYYLMFYRCTSLTTAPDIPADTVPTATSRGCCTGMFDGCTNLNYIKCLVTNQNAGSGYRNNFSNWARGIAATGTFVKKAGASWTNGVGGIPTGWTVTEE